MPTKGAVKAAAAAEKTEEGEGTEPVGETNAERFKRIAPKRVANALKAIALIGNCSGAGYEYTEEQVEKVTEALWGEIDTMKSKFSGKKKSTFDFEL